MEEAPLHVVATAGHVDHGKSSLIVRLTGIDPDRWEEEKRRGLTIDLGFAWCTLPSGREVGFVDVPGHERFVRNMLAGVGPVRLVLFVVAADEGWKPQSEEHLQILDVLDAHAGLIALTKRDLVDGDTLAVRQEEVRVRLEGTALEGSAVVACSAATGEGMDDLRAALDAMLDGAPVPEDRGRPRIWVDRAFTIHGAGTVVTGTLAGGRLATGQEVAIEPQGSVARVRSLQTHRRAVEVARPVSRVAANLAGTSKQSVERGDALVLPGQWRPAVLLEVRLRPVRGLSHPLTTRGAYKLYVGSAERDARLHLYDVREVPPEGAFARLRLSRPLVTEAGDRFVLREAGRRETVAGGVVLDADPPARPGPDSAARLARRDAAGRRGLPEVLVAERGAVRAADLPVLAGTAPAVVPGAVRAGALWVATDVLERMETAALEVLAAHHREHPLRPGLDAAEIRRALLASASELGTALTALEQDLPAAVLVRLEEAGRISRDGTTLRLAEHQVTLGPREEEAERMIAAVASGEPVPPTVRDLEASGFPGDLIRAACAVGRLVRVSPEIVVTPGFAARAEEVARAEAGSPEGLTVSRFRELLGTSRKYALPLLAWLDERGVTRRDGDVRRLA